MDFDGISYLMMADGLNPAPPKNFPSTNTSGSWSDMSELELDWPTPQMKSVHSPHRGHPGVDTTDGGPLDDDDFSGERLSKSLDLDQTSVGIDPSPRFDSLDSSHERGELLGQSEERRDLPKEDVSGGSGQGFRASPSVAVHNSNGARELYSLVEDDRPDYYPSSDEEVMDEPDGDQGERLKVKLLTVWNNMKHGFALKTKTNFKYDSPIILLGKCYCCSKSEREEHKKVLGKSGGLSPATTTFERFKRDFASKIWFTYRKDFPKLYGSQLTSDVGWGCMLRSGQMIIAQAFVMHYLRRDWTVHHAHQNRREAMLHQQIIRLFGDHPVDESPFSIQRLVRIGVDHGKRPGDWYGPASVAYVLRDAIDQTPNDNPLLSQLCIYVAPDCTVYIQDVIDLCTRVSPPPQPSTNSPHAHIEGHTYSHSRGESPIRTISGQLAQATLQEGTSSRGHEDHWRAAIILVPVRLGGESLNPIYSQCVMSLLAHELCLGIIGGRPKHSLYFVGWQDEKLIYLDPHFCQDTVDMRFRDFHVNTFHCLSPRKMALTKMDPSCTLGFYCPTRAALNTLVNDMKKLVQPPKDQGMYPLFVFHQGRSIDVEHSQPAQGGSMNRFLRVRHLDKKGRIKQPSQDSDDFVFL